MSMMTNSIYFHLLFWFWTLTTQTFACPFQNYEEGLLQSLNPISIETKLITLDNSMNGDRIAFGYWSFCIPLWEVQHYPIVESQFNNKVQEDGQLFFLIKSLNNIEPIILGYLSFDEQNLQVLHNINVQIESKFLQHSFQYSAETYEGIWILTLLTFVPQSSEIIIEITDQQPKIISTDFSGISEIQFIIGGRGFITMNSIQYNLNIFRGRLSVLISVPQFTFNDNIFNQISDNCKIPQKIIGEQTKYIVQGYQQFKGDAQLLFTIDQVGNRYCLSGWVKYDTSTTLTETIFTLIRLTAFKNYQNNYFFGDNLFVLMAYFSLEYPEFTGLIIQASPYIIPQKGLTNLNENLELFDVRKLIHNNINKNYQYYQGLQQWHFLQYEYGRTGKGEAKMLLQVQFFTELGLQSVTFGNYHRIACFTNSNFYLYFGGDDDAVELLRADIYDFKFEYNYNNDKQFFFNACHYSCLTCNGPLENNCISCDPYSFRVFLIEKYVCQCKQNYIDYDGNMICQQFSQDYLSIKETEIVANVDSQCQSGYFYLMDNNKQSKCIKWYIFQIIQSINKFP